MASSARSPEPADHHRAEGVETGDGRRSRPPKPAGTGPIGSLRELGRLLNSGARSEPDDEPDDG